MNAKVVIGALVGATLGVLGMSFLAGVAMHPKPPKDQGLDILAAHEWMPQPYFYGIAPQLNAATCFPGRESNWAPHLSTILDKEKYTSISLAYTRHLGLFRNRVLRVLEIGAGCPASAVFKKKAPIQYALAFWGAFLPCARLTWMDFDISCGNKTVDNFFRIHHVDKSNYAALDHFSATQRPFHVIIDDGGYSSYKQILTIQHFFPLLPAGGIYIIEDLVSFHDSDPTTWTSLFGKNYRAPPSRTIPCQK